MAWKKKNGHWEYEGSPDGISFVEEAKNLARPPADDGDYWGNWVYRKEPDLLVHKQHNYEVPTSRDEVPDSDEFVDWLAQLREKTWITSQDLGDFIRAFDYVRGLRWLRPLANTKG
ncbi:hypothetical protein [Archangium sp.]|jgi:hypothetical protein|uniref:hypothetical protein n=1 Tax=Archangium sp. TaxID=1872627 RepID=UPI002EDAA2F0